MELYETLRNFRIGSHANLGCSHRNRFANIKKNVCVDSHKNKSANVRIKVRSAKFRMKFRKIYFAKHFSSFAHSCYFGQKL